MNEFRRDDTWSRQKRDEYLKPHYTIHSEEGRFVFCDKGDLAKELQQAAVDTIMQGEEGRVWAIEEKIVRWKGRRYTAFALETWSCTVPERERQGWMYTAKCDVLLYCFEQADKSLLCYAIPFQRLQQRSKMNQAEQVVHTTPERAIFSLRRQVAAQDKRIKDLERRLVALEGGLRQGTGELKAIINDICDRLEGLEATIDRNAELLAQGITGNTTSVERLRAALRAVTRCLIDDETGADGSRSEIILHSHRILGTESVQAIVEVYHRLEK